MFFSYYEIFFCNGWGCLSLILFCLFLSFLISEVQNFVLDNQKALGTFSSKISENGQCFDQVFVSFMLKSFAIKEQSYMVFFTRE